MVPVNCEQREYSASKYLYEYQEKYCDTCDSTNRNHSFLAWYGQGDQRHTASGFWAMVPKTLQYIFRALVAEDNPDFGTLLVWEPLRWEMNTICPFMEVRAPSCNIHNYLQERYLPHKALVEQVYFFIHVAHHNRPIFRRGLNQPCRNKRQISTTWDGLL
jgi:hypothetical protein